MKCTVFIPTLGRVGFESQITLRELHKYAPRHLDRVHLVCPAMEVDEHRRNFPWVKVHAQPSWCKHIGDVRQWCLMESPTRGVMMIDDDMYFYRRTEPELYDHSIGLLERTVDDELSVLIERIEEYLDNGYAHGGVSARQGNNRVYTATRDVARINNVHFFDRDVVLGEGLRFGEMMVMEDFYVTLSLLERGYPNRCIYEWCWCQRGSGTKGGCSQYRTAEVQAKAARMLASTFPDYVRVVTKRSNTDGYWVGVEERLDVNIQWRKAFNKMPDLRQFASYTPAVPILDSGRLND